MDIITIVGAVFRYLPWALLGTAILLPLYAGAFVLYKKVFHGPGTLAVKQWAALVLLPAWLLLVLGLTTLSRGANFTGSVNLSLFSGYINAWHEWSYAELQLILFNMLMFAPLGFLLPLLSRKGEGFKTACLVSALTALFIEMLQLVTGRGIFELDDLLHNFLGSAFGYFVMMFFLACLRRKRLDWRSLAKALALPLLFGAGIGAAVAVYNGQEYGNMPILPAEKQDMSLISIENKAGLSQDPGTACIYKNPRANDPQYGRAVVQAVQELTGVSFKPARREGKNKVYVGDPSNAQLTVFSSSGQWTYTTWAEQTPALTQEKALVYKEQIEAWLNKYDLLPQGALFRVQDDSILRWDAPPPDESSPRQDFALGCILVRFDQKGGLSGLDYFMDQNEYVENVGVMPPQQAYQEILGGNFEQYVPFEKGDALVVENCSLAYAYDTKGFYRPVYRFTGYVEGPERPWEALVPAMR